MAASYPATIKTYVDLIDNVDLAEAATPNSHQDEINAIETELGTVPKGSETDVKARLERGPVIKLTNKSGAERSAGDVVIQDTATDNAYKTTTTQGDKKQVYVVRETTADNAEGHVQRSGRVQLQVTGATTRGNYIRTSTTAGKAEDAGAAIVNGVFGRVLEAVGGAGLCWVELFGTTLLAAAGGAWEHVETFDATGGGSAFVSATLPTDSDLFMVVIEDILMTAAGKDLQFRPNSDSTADKDTTTMNGLTLTVATASFFQLGRSGKTGEIAPINGVIYVPRLIESVGRRWRFSGNVISGETDGTDIMFLKGYWADGVAASVSTMRFSTDGVFSAGAIHIYKSVQP